MKPAIPQSIKKAITCPVSHKIMLHPVTLIPSMITMERDFAKAIFEDAKKNNEKPLCPVTKVELTSFEINQNIHDLINSLLKLYKFDAKDRYEEMKATQNLSINSLPGTAQALAVAITPMLLNLWSYTPRPTTSVRLPYAAILRAPYFNKYRTNDLMVFCIGTPSPLFWTHWNPESNVDMHTDLFASTISHRVAQEACVERYFITNPTIFRTDCSTMINLRRSHSHGANIILLFDGPGNELTPALVKETIDQQSDRASQMYSIHYDKFNVPRLDDPATIVVPDPINTSRDTRVIAGIADELLAASTQKLLTWANQLRTEPRAEQKGLLGHPFAPASGAIHSTPDSYRIM